MVRFRFTRWRLGFGFKIQFEPILNPLNLELISSGSEVTPEGSLLGHPDGQPLFDAAFGASFGKQPPLHDPPLQIGVRNLPHIAWRY